MVTDIDNTELIIARLSGFNRHEEVVGILGREGSDMVKIAATHEFGATISVTPRMRKFLHSIGFHLLNSTTHIEIPARPWISVGLERSIDDIDRLFQEGVHAVMEGAISAEALLKRAGMLAVDSIKEYAATPGLPLPPNHPFTIARKGSTNPLVDSGRMIRSVNQETRTRIL